MRSGSRLRSSGVLAASGLTLWACNGLIGVEDLHQEPNPNSGGAAGAQATKGGNAGASATAGGKVGTGSGGGAGVSTTSGGANPTSGGASTTSGGSTGNGGDVGVDAGAGGVEGGAPGTGGKSTSGGAANGGKGGAAPTGGVGGVGGAASGGKSSGGAASGGATGTGGAPGAVSGTVIDKWGHPVPSVTVTIGAAAAATDTSGKFSIPNVAAGYDVTLVVRPPQGGGTANYAWIYQGLTRRDPTLQVYQGLESQDANPHIVPTGAVATNKNVFAFGSPDGSNSVTFSSTGGTPLGALDWYGPLSTSGGYHVLSWKADTNGFPTEYSTYLSGTTAPAANSTVEFPLTFTAGPLAATTVSGTVASPTSGSRTNYLFSRFTDNATIPIASVTPASAAAFSFLAPTITGQQILVAASEGTDDFFGPYAIAHKVVTAGSTNTALSIPAPPINVQPADGRSPIDATTTFQWTSSTDSVFLMHIENTKRYQAMYIVTTAKSLKLPDVGGGFFLVKGEACWWQVEVHGAFTSVDQVARPGGFFSPFGDKDHTEPQFTRTGDDGFFAISDAFSMVP